jgi:hypothetical protein
MSKIHLNLLYKVKTDKKLVKNLFAYIKDRQKTKIVDFSVNIPFNLRSKLIKL